MRRSDFGAVQDSKRYDASPSLVLKCDVRSTESTLYGVCRVRREREWHIKMRQTRISLHCIVEYRTNRLKSNVDQPRAVICITISIGDRKEEKELILAKGVSNVDSPLVCNPPMISDRPKLSIWALSSYWLCFFCLFLFFFLISCFCKSISVLVKSSDPNVDENPFHRTFDVKPPGAKEEKAKKPEKA